MKKYIFYSLFLLIFFNISLFSQSVSFKGQFWSDGIIYHHSDGKGKLRFNNISEFLLLSNINNTSCLEFKFSFLIDNKIIFGDSSSAHADRYRLWMRYTNDNIDFRLGLQKIAFGPGYILHPLAWFDKSNFTDIIGQTQGVESMRIIYTPSNELSIWTWLIDSGKKLPSYGGRIELSNHLGNWGITYHRDVNSELHQGIGFMGPVTGKNHSLGFDYRYDGLIGFWTENSFLFVDNQSNELYKQSYNLSFGLDYTVSVLDGIYIMSETMHSSYLSATDLEFNITNTVINLDVPVNFLNKFSLVSGFNWDNHDTYHLLRFISTYDDFNIESSTSIQDGKWLKNISVTFVYNY